MSTIVGQRSGLFFKKVAGGLAVIQDAATRTGNIFFVDSAHANAEDSVGKGTSPDYPLATIDYAVGLCTANQGDLILVAPGHAETLDAAAAIDLDVAGITVLGLGNGEDRPTITVGSTEDASTVEVGAADVAIKNIIFQPGNDGVDILLDVNADGALVEDCELRSDEANAYQADTYIDVNGGGANAADRCTIRRCKISSITAGAAQAINIGAVEDALVIEDCWIDGDFTAAGILSGSIFTNALIRRNVVSNRAAGVHAIELTAACTGMLVDNRMYGDTLGTILDPGSLKCLGNLETDAVDQAGVDSPRTSAGGFPDASITLAAFAADGLQALQDEAQDAIQGAQLDHLVALTDGAGAALLTVVDGSIISKLVSKVSGGDTSSFDNTTDSLEMASDKLGAFSGDGGAAQDDSVKASLDLAHTNIDAILADTGTDGVAIAADGITNAKIADNALASEQFALSAGEKTTDGVVVTRATAALPQGAAAALFTVTGLVLLKRIVGYVTVQIGAFANATKLVGNSTGAGASTDICGAVELNAAAVDTRLEITGTFANAMVATIDVPLAKVQATELVIPPGTIDLNCAGSDGGGGRIRWSVTYVPLESGAQIVAA